MNAKNTLWIGLGLLALGLVLFSLLKSQVLVVFTGGLTLLLLLVGLMFIAMGIVQVREERDNERKEAEEAARGAQMTASE